MPHSLLKKHNINFDGIEVVSLDDRSGAERVAEAIANGEIVVSDFGSTYGTSFKQDSDIRIEVAKVRQEDLADLATVSVTASSETFLNWIDFDRLHPRIHPLISNGALDVIKSIGFVRIPLNDRGHAENIKECINQNAELQVLIMDEDPILHYLEKQHGMNSIAVRSANITGYPEEPFVHGALEYAKAIQASVFAVRSMSSLEIQIEDHKIHSRQQEKSYHGLVRKRVGSVPIIVLPQVGENPVITLARFGNVHPETMRRLCQIFIDQGVGYEIDESGDKDFRMLYEAPDHLETSHEIGQHLRQVALLPKKPSKSKVKVAKALGGQKPAPPTQEVIPIPQII